MSKRKVVVTGIGVVSPLGSTLDTMWTRMLNGESGVGRITHFDASEFKAQIAGEVDGFDPDEIRTYRFQLNLVPKTFNAKTLKVVVKAKVVAP